VESGELIVESGAWCLVQDARCGCWVKKLKVKGKGKKSKVRVAGCRMRGAGCQVLEAGARCTERMVT